MSRCSIAALALVLTLVLTLGDVSLAAAQTPPPKPTEDVQLPPEEDKAQIPKQYVFNPLQSKKEVTVGEFYFKKGDYRAAAIRFREATKWDDSNSEAWLRLGETEEKNHSPKTAREAYEKYLQLAPEAKNAPEIKKRRDKLKG
jgi:tetratricopeptide (TPR) repeat protein